MSGDHNMNQRATPISLREKDFQDWLANPLTKALKQSHKQQIKSIINLLLTQHQAAKNQHNHWLIAANLVAAEVGEEIWSEK